MLICKGTLIVDLDGTLCPIKAKNERYEDLEPYYTMIEKLREWKNEGFRIIINTSRNMRTYGGNLGLINVHTARMTMDWLEKWEVPYDEILFAKPWPGEKGFYIDDRAIRPDEFLRFSEDEIEQILEKGKNYLKKDGENND
jgi:capsule biosynthesis phosphatase